MFYINIKHLYVFFMVKCNSIESFKIEFFYLN